MIRQTTKPASVRCAVYTRKSTEEGLDQEFNTLDAQRDAGEMYIGSQKHTGWECTPERYDDGGFTGGNMDRPALRQLMSVIEAGQVDCVVVYKVDRLSRSLLDFARMMEVFDRHGVSFVSVTQQFNTSTSMGRLILNVLLSFAQFEREMISERTRDKIAATRRRGKWTGGMPVLGYDLDDQSRLIVHAEEADRVRAIFELFLEKGTLIATVRELNRLDWPTKQWRTRKGRVSGGKPFAKNTLHHLLTNPVYLGKVKYKTETFPGEHQAIVPPELFQRVQDALRRNRNGAGQRGKGQVFGLLKGLLRCANCDASMGHTYTSRGERRYRYYVCTNAQRRGWDACPTKSLPAAEIERAVVDEIRAIGRDPGLVAATFGRVRQEAEKLITELERERKRLSDGQRRRVVHLATLPEEAMEERAELQLESADCDTRLGETREQLSLLRNSLIADDEILAALAAFDPVWQALEPAEQARVLSLLLERVTYNGDTREAGLSFRPIGLRGFVTEFSVDEAFA